MVLHNNTIKGMVDYNLRGAEIGDAMVISSKITFMEFFTTPLNDETVLELSEKYPLFFFTNDYVEVRLNNNFLFINHGGFYSCFDNLTDHNPLFKNKSKWNFTSNHDSCWRTDAFSNFDNLINDIKSDLMDINKEYKLDNIYIPKHIIPNYGDLKCSKILTFDKLDLNWSHQSGTVEHFLHSTEKGKFLIKNC